MQPGDPVSSTGGADAAHEGQEVAADAGVGASASLAADRSGYAEHGSGERFGAPRAGGGLNESNPWGAAAFVLGLVGALLALLVVTFPLSFILGVMAVVFGVIGRRAWIRTAMANAGIVLGLASVALSIVGALLVVSFVSSAVDRVDQIDEEVQAVLDDAIERLSEELDRLADDTSDRIVGEIDEIGEDLGENIGEGIRDELDAELGEISESISSIDADR